MVCVFRVALHLQLMSISNTHHEQQGWADSTALSSMARAVDSVQTRQSSAERDVYAQQQQTAAAAASSRAGLAAAAEDALVTSCEVAQKLLQQLQELGTSDVMELMTQVHIVCAMCVCVRACLPACMPACVVRAHVCACSCLCVKPK